MAAAKVLIAKNDPLSLNAACAPPSRIGLRQRIWPTTQQHTNDRVPDKAMIAQQPSSRRHEIDQRDHEQRRNRPVTNQCLHQKYQRTVRTRQPVRRCWDDPD